MLSRLTRPSILQPESVGGLIAQGGFSYQRDIAVAMIPELLASSTFDSLAIEMTGDIEIKYFEPGHGFAYETIEVKKGNLPGPDFWLEIDRFGKLYDADPHIRSRFVLICAHLPQRETSLTRDLKRLQAAIGFFPDTSAIWQNSVAELARGIVDRGDPESDARFMLRHVKIVVTSVESCSIGQGGFAESLARVEDHLRIKHAAVPPELALDLANLVDRGIGMPIGREEFERVIEKHLTGHPLSRPDYMPLTTLASIPQNEPSKMSRDNPIQILVGNPSREWQEKLVRPLIGYRDWVYRRQRPRRILLQGNRSLAESFAIGAVFSRKAGFTVVCTSGSELWATDTFPEFDCESPSVDVTHTTPENTQQTSAGIVSISAVYDITQSVTDSSRPLGIDTTSRIDVFAPRPFASGKEALGFCRTAKTHIEQWLTAHPDIRHLHIFIRGLAFMALVLGHEWNFRTEVTLYRWAGSAYIVAGTLVDVKSSIVLPNQ